MNPLAFFLKSVFLSLKNIFLYLYLHKLATALIWLLIGCSTIYENSTVGAATSDATEERCSRWPPSPLPCLHQTLAIHLQASALALRLGFHRLHHSLPVCLPLLHPFHGCTFPAIGCCFELSEFAEDVSICWFSLPGLSCARVCSIHQSQQFLLIWL